MFTVIRNCRVLKHFVPKNYKRKTEKIIKIFDSCQFFIHNLLTQNVSIPTNSILPTHSTTTSINIYFFLLSSTTFIPLFNFSSKYCFYLFYHFLIRCPSKGNNSSSIFLSALHCLNLL